MAQSSYWNKIADKTRKENRPFFSLAPMEAVTGSVFRRVVEKAAAPDVFYTEFTNALSITHPLAKESAKGRLYIDPKENPKPIIQLWGNNGEDFSKAVKEVKKQGFEAIDINTGCPDIAVIKNHSGSDLIKHFDTAKEVIEGARKTNLPVSVKTRIGYSEVDEYKTWIPFLLEQKLPVLTIHVRTREEMSNVPAHYELIDDLVKMRDEIAPDTLLQINGDIADYQAGMKLYHEHPGIDGVMIGRGIFTNPFAFEPVKREHSAHELLGLLRYQLDLYDEFVAMGIPGHFAPLQRFFKIYVRGMKGASAIRNDLMQTKTTDDARKIIDRIDIKD
ncbi:tRNA-dihydrouridine synthase family protein [Companilactobacillus allii]|uniref:tRNA-dihydrouridine synthase n=1 Tax=Companilactobacillus allii TaxID=1847728 RepID=A0A1P8Q4F6_9LACO|nr:tRNA-dihydrouridine synthase family protein [Companilactobacillus allii]APX72659.1 tRNA-dihydrouridine synthase [Companilactobacillus allii]USQ69763.1 tRNA-dihydrouridine synthase family protein [Companilactobacillus allii]